MKSLSMLLVVAGLLASVGTATAQQRIPIQEEKPIELYALGAGGTNGVFKFTLADPTNPTRLNGDLGGKNFTSSSKGGGGTFLSADKVVGVKYNSISYPFEASEEGEDGIAWYPSYFAYSSAINKVYDMTYDEKNDVIYCWYAYSSYVSTLGIYNPTSHTITRVGNAADASIFAIAIDKEGQLWGIGTYGQFYKIDKTTGVASELTGGWGLSVQFGTGSPMSATVDPASNMMYVVAPANSYATTSTLYKIDLSTRNVETIAALSGTYNCLSIVGSSIAAGAPAPVEGLSAEFNGEATVVSFTAPMVDASGKDLSGSLSYTVTVDTYEAATGTAHPGEPINVILHLDDGTHEIQVTVANSEGSSKTAKATVFSGYDQPGAVSNLQANLESDEVTLTWDAPTGKNGGMLDVTKLSYTVSCNGTAVATGLTATSYETTLTGYYGEYTYTVTVVYDQTDGESQSVSVVGGNAYPIPYSLNLNEVSTLGAAGITVLDPNTGSSVITKTWELAGTDNDKYLRSDSENSYHIRTDYVYLPKVSLKAGVPYVFSFQLSVNLETSTTNKYADFSVLIAKEPTYEAADYTVLKNEQIPAVNRTFNWEDYSVEFTVDADGDYFLGLLDYAPKGTYPWHSINVKDLSIDVNIPTPAAVSDLAATAQGDNNRNIDITFTLPTKDTKGEDLTEITGVEIYRDDTLIKTYDSDLTPGQEMSYTDENAPRGVVSYSVVVLNDSKASQKETVEVTVGYTTNLVIELVAAPEGAVKPTDGGVITVKVSNDGAEVVADGAYNVVLYCNGTQVDSQTGTELASDASKEYTFNLVWTGSTPQTVEYIVKVEAADDENLADNDTAPIAVTFQKTSGVDDAVCTGVEISVANGAITINGAEGEAVLVCAADGRVVVSTTATAVYTTAVLPRGVYVVCVGSTAVKVIL